jgi:hypothetical protein
MTAISPELAILFMNALVLCAGYFFIFPRFCGADYIKLAINDVLACSVTLIVAGTYFWGSGVSFSLLITSTNWFWFTLITYLLIETPLMLRYFKKYDVWSSLDD